MADVLDVLTLDEGKSAINMAIGTTEHDDTVARHITTISRLLDERVGPIVQRTVTAETHRGGFRLVWLRRWPVASISLVREARNGAIATLSAVAFGGTGDGYSAPAFERDPALLSGVLERRRHGQVFSWWPGENTVEVTYDAGRYADTASVGARYKDTAGAILRRLWKREAGAWAQASTFFEGNDGTAGSGFFRVAVPIVDELLGSEVQALGSVAR